MSPAATELLAAIRKLPLDEQHALADELRDELSPPDIDEMTDAEFAAELERRAEEARRDPSVLIPWQQVLDMK